IFVKDELDYLKILGFLNTKVAQQMLNTYNTTLALQVRDVRNLPYDKRLITPVADDIELLVQELINCSKIDWDSYETSWDFQRHPLLRPISRLSDAYTT